jgi:hypothetical protein
MSLITPETMKAHRATWWVYTGGRTPEGMPERIRRQASMRGFWPGYDVTCSCGWETKTGGAVRRAVAEDLEYHRWSEQTRAEADAEHARP